MLRVVFGGCAWGWVSLVVMGLSWTILEYLAYTIFLCTTLLCLNLLATCRHFGSRLLARSSQGISRPAHPHLVATTFWKYELSFRTNVLVSHGQV